MYDSICVRVSRNDSKCENMKKRGQKERGIIILISTGYVRNRNSSHSMNKRKKIITHEDAMEENPEIGVRHKI